MDIREKNLNQWVQKTLAEQQHQSLSTANEFALVSVSGDASFRRYFRIVLQSNSYIAVDAPPNTEKNHEFVAVASALVDLNINAPQVLAVDFQQGFLLLTDLGDKLYLAELQTHSDNPAVINTLYQQAISTLVTMQQCTNTHGYPLPTYDAKHLNQEMELFREWFLLKLLKFKLNSEDHQLLEDCFGKLTASALEQPTVFVHRDYHSRNLMITDNQNPGVLDFQDAVMGPVTYDLVSLLRDCYISWPKKNIQSWQTYYLKLAQNKGVLNNCNPMVFSRWFDWMGVQRHLKAIGIFARLYLRDNKPNYLGDIPRTFDYLLEVLPNYSELEAFAIWLKECVQTKLANSKYFQTHHFKPTVNIP